MITKIYQVAALCAIAPSILCGADVNHHPKYIPQPKMFTAVQWTRDDNTIIWSDSTTKIMDIAHDRTHKRTILAYRTTDTTIVLYNPETQQILQEIPVAQPPQETVTPTATFSHGAQFLTIGTVTSIRKSQTFRIYRLNEAGIYQPYATIPYTPPFWSWFTLPALTPTHFQYDVTTGTIACLERNVYTISEGYTRPSPVVLIHTRNNRPPSILESEIHIATHRNIKTGSKFKCRFSTNGRYLVYKAQDNAVIFIDRCNPTKLRSLTTNHTIEDKIPVALDNEGRTALYKGYNETLPTCYILVHYPDCTTFGTCGTKLPEEISSSSQLDISSPLWPQSVFCQARIALFGMAL